MVARNRKIVLPKIWYVFLFLPFLFLFSAKLKFPYKEIINIIPYFGLLGWRFVTPKNKKELWKLFKNYLSLSFLIVGVSLSLLTQFQWLEWVKFHVWVFTLIGYYHIFYFLPIEFNTIRPVYLRIRKANRERTRKILIPFFLILQSGIFFTYYEFSEIWHYQEILLPQSFYKNWMPSISSREIRIFYVFTLWISTYWVQEEFRLKNKITSFAAKILLLISSWVGVLLFLPYIFSLILVLLFFFALKSASGKRFEKVSDRQLIYCQFILVFFIFILVLLIHPSKSWIQIHPIPDSWFAVTIQNKSSNYVKRGKLKSLDIQITNSGIRNWPEGYKSLYVDFWLIGTGKNKRTKKVQSFFIEDGLQVNESKELKVKFAVPWWFSTGVILAELRDRNLGNVANFEVINRRDFRNKRTSAPLKVKNLQYNQPSLVYQILETEYDAIYHSKQNRIAISQNFIFVEILANQLDQFLRSPISGDLENYTGNFKSIDISSFVVKFGLLGGIPFLFFIFLAPTRLYEYYYTKDQRNGNVYLWLGFLLFFGFGAFSNFPMTCFGQIFLILLISRFKLKEPEPVTDCGF